jgi:hypothetical protein
LNNQDISIEATRSKSIQYEIPLPVKALPLKERTYLPVLKISSRLNPYEYLKLQKINFNHQNYPNHGHKGNEKGTQIKWFLIPEVK